MNQVDLGRRDHHIAETASDDTDAENGSPSSVKDVRSTVIERAKAARSDSVVNADDDAILQALDAYLLARSSGPVDHAEFIAKCDHDHPGRDLAEQLPGLLNSIDALHGFAVPSQPDSIGESWDDLVSKTLGDFEIISELGRGGMGIVYEARQVSLDRIVALKVLPLSVVLDKQQIDRFMIEAQLAGQLDHPNIVPIYWVGRASGVHCYTMPLIKGRSLEKVIAERRTNAGTDTGTGTGSKDSEAFDSASAKRMVQQSLRWTIQACEALQHAHQNGTIHRDIKPSNLIIDQNRKLWVTDFGLARCRNATTLTQSGVVVGTFRYMSPEQASGKATVDHRSDIYCLGLTLYELLTGHSVYQNTFPNLADRTRASIEPVSPRRLNPAISRDIETIVLKTLSIDPAGRYDSAQELARDLQRTLDGLPIHARRPTLTDHFFKWTLRHRRPVAALSVLGIVTLVASLFVTAWYAGQQSQLQSALRQSNHNIRIANRNLQQAQSNFRQTREVLDHFGLLAAEELRGVAGAEAIRETLVGDLLKYYERFASQAQDTDALQADLAKTHFRAAQIIEEIGDLNRAYAAYQRATELYENQPPSREFIHQIALCRNNMALIQAENGNPEQAATNYARAISGLETISNSVASDGQGSPAISRVRHTLAKIHGNYGLLSASVNDADHARQQFNQSLTLLANDSDHDDATSITAAMIWNNLSHLEQNGNVAEALRLNNQAIRVLRDRIESSGNKVNPQTRRSLALSLNNQAALLTRQDRIAQALTIYQEAIAHFRTLVDQSPLVVRYTEELAVTYNNYGRALHRDDNAKEARSAIQRSSDLLQLLTRRRPDESRYQIALEGVRENLVKIDETTNLSRQTIRARRSGDSAGMEARSL